LHAKPLSLDNLDNNLDNNSNDDLNDDLDDNLYDDLSYLLSLVFLELKHFSNKELSAQLLKLSSNFAFSHTYYLIFSTLAFILRRIRDKNILPYIHVLFTFLSTTILILYLNALLCDIAP